jgi:copper chaperone CopZ
LGRKSTLRALLLLALLFACRPLPAEYLQIQLKVYGLDCELCARGVGASVHRMAGVKSVEVSLKTGMIGIQLMPGNTLKMSDLRKRIQDNGFLPMEARVTALVSTAQNSKFSEPVNLTMFPTLTRTPPNSHSTSIEGACVGNPRSESASGLRLGRSTDRSFIFPYGFAVCQTLPLPSPVISPALVSWTKV